LAPEIDTRLVDETGTALVLSLDASSEALRDDPPSHPPPKLLVRKPQPATEASVTAKTKPEITTRDKASAPAASIAEIHILQGQLDRQPFDVLNHPLQIVALLA
jgi:hypothetical protein